MKVNLEWKIKRKIKSLFVAFCINSIETYKLFLLFIYKYAILRLKHYNIIEKHFKTLQRKFIRYIEILEKRIG